jgi:hypothetical protein
MKPSQAHTLLVELIQSRLPGLLVGAPGVGKSDIVAQAAETAEADLIISHPAVADPTDAKGLPWVSKDSKSATFLPFGELERALKAKKPTVWFLDDLGQAPAAVQASYMQLLLARRVNNHVLPDCVTFLAATNRRTDRAAVSGILEPVKSRFATIILLEPDQNDWSTWAMDHDMPPQLIAYIRFRPDQLCNFQPSADLTNSPLPRTWANVGRLLGTSLPPAIMREAIAGAVGEASAVEFCGFLDMYAELPSIDAIMLDPNSGKIPTKPAALYAVVTALGMRANAGNFDRIGKYAERLVGELRGEFAALLLRDSIRRDEEIVNTQAFVRLAAGELGQLISGQA